MSFRFCASNHHSLHLLLSAAIFLCSFILARPLYFCYLIFLLPYAFKLLAFLYPLFLTSFLLVVAFCAGDDDVSCCRVGYLIVLYDSVVNRLRLGKQFDWNLEEDECVEDFGMFEMLFGSSNVQHHPQALEREIPVDVEVSDQTSPAEFAGNKPELDSTPTPKLEQSCSGTEKPGLQNFLKLLDQFEKMSSPVEEKKMAAPSSGTKSNKAIEESPVTETGSKSKETTLEKLQSDRCISVSSDNADEFGPSERYNLRTYGSMRQEREWKKTLACKLFEERHNVGNGEGMDSLWEAYEMDSSANKPKHEKKKKTKTRRATKTEIVRDIEDEESVIGDDNVQMCCLQAIKLSTGRMNLGIGRPNLMKITKAIKGIGWLHHATKHSKKVHNNGDR